MKEFILSNGRKIPSVGLGTFKLTNEEAFKAGVKDIVRLLEDNIDNFPEYRDSSTYEARHYKGYENRQDSKVYYF